MQPAHRRERRERRGHDRRRPAGHRDRRAAGRLQRHGLGLGLDHQRAHPADRGLHAGVAGGRLPVDQAQQPHSRDRATASTAPRRAINSAPRSRASATRTATASAIWRSARPGASPNGRAGAGRGRRRTGPGGPGDAQPRRDAAAADDRRRRGRRRPRRLAGRRRRRRRRWQGRRARRRPGEAGLAGAAYLVRGAAGTTSDLALAASKIAPGRSGRDDGQHARGRLLRWTARAPTRSWPRPARTGPAPGSSWAAAALPCCLRRRSPPAPPPAPRRLLRASPPPPPASPPSPPATPPSPPLTTTDGGRATAPEGTVVTQNAAATTATATKSADKPAIKKKKKRLPLCPVKKAKPRYHLVNGKRVKLKPRPCRPRVPTTAKVKRA